MRILRWALRLSLIVAVVAGAQEKHKTEAQTDGCEGPVRTVATHVEMAGVKWQQPGGPSLIFPVTCRDCEYDSEGYRTRSGQTIEDGRFLGENIQLTRDSLGHLIARTRVNASDGKTIEHDTMGPFGPVEETYSTDSPVARSTKTYDSLGHLSEWLSFDAAGRLVSRQTIRTNPDGQWTERATWGKNGELTYRETYDPETDFQRFESYDDSGAVKVSFTFSHDKVQTFWAASEEPNQFGSSFTSNRGHGDVDRFLCRKDSGCEVSHVHYTYADSTKRNPTSVEWYDPEGTLLYASYYKYEFDDQHNWTKRTIWVLSPDTSGHALYETDTRVIAYWDR